MPLTIQGALKKTQEQLLREIRNWINSDNGLNVFWLQGVAGSGKSTIAFTISDELQKARQLGAFLFFGVADTSEDVFNRKRSKQESFINTMAYQLALSNLVIAKHVADAALNNLNVPIGDMFEELILKPVSTAATDTPNLVRRIVIILDGLDEYGDSSSRRDILKVLKANFSKFPHGVRFLITSRPDLKLDLNTVLTPIRTFTIDHNSVASLRDVTRYLTDKLTQLLKGHGVHNGNQLAKNIECLCEAAHGHFIWALAVYNYIEDSGSAASQILGELAEEIRSHGSLSQLSGFSIHALYSNILKSKIPRDGSCLFHHFSKILYLLTEIKVTLSTEDIDIILRFPPQYNTSSKPLVEDLQSVLACTPNSRSRIRPLHSSFADFLKSDKQRGNIWHIDVTENSKYFTQQCIDSFDTMHQGLEFNICGLESSYKSNRDIPDLKNRIEAKISEGLENACLSWAQQLRILPFSRELDNKLSRFLHNHLLFWLEVLSLIGKVDVAFSALADAIRWTAVSFMLVYTFLC